MKYEAVVMSESGALLCCYWPDLSLEEIQKRAEADDPVWRHRKVKFRPLTDGRAQKYKVAIYGCPGEGFRASIE